MHQFLKAYKELVPFIGKALGDNVEIALHEATDDGMPIIALYNGQMSGRKIGDPLTSLGEHIIQTKQYINHEYVTNYKSLNDSGKVVRSSSYFIKDEDDNLIGTEDEFYAMSEAEAIKESDKSGKQRLYRRIL